MNDQLESLVAELIEKGIVFEDAVGEFEKRYIKLVLEKVNGNQSKAADILGIHRNTLGRKLGQLGLGDNHFRRHRSPLPSRRSASLQSKSRTSPRP